MQRLKGIIEKTDTKAGMAFAIVVQCLIFISVVTFSIETLPNLSPTAQQWLNEIDFAIFVFFTIEYLSRIVVADHPWQYMRSFYGIMDLVAIFPFFLGRPVQQVCRIISTGHCRPN